MNNQPSVEKRAWVLVGGSAFTDDVDLETQITNTYNVAGVFTTARRAYLALRNDVSGPVQVVSRGNGAERCLILRSKQFGSIYRLAMVTMDVA